MAEKKIDRKGPLQEKVKQSSSAGHVRNKFQTMFLWHESNAFIITICKIHKKNIRLAQVYS